MVAQGKGCAEDTTGTRHAGDSGAEWVQWLVRGPPVMAPQLHPVLERADAQEGGWV